MKKLCTFYGVVNLVLAHVVIGSEVRKDDSFFLKIDLPATKNLVDYMKKDNFTMCIEDENGLSFALSDGSIRSFGLVYSPVLESHTYVPIEKIEASTGHESKNYLFATKDQALKNLLEYMNKKNPLKCNCIMDQAEFDFTLSSGDVKSFKIVYLKSLDMYGYFSKKLAKQLAEQEK